MSQEIEVKGLEELIKDMNAYPTELTKVVAVNMSASLNVLWEKVPAYPKQKQGTTYRRTGTLGRSLGSDQSGGAIGGQPSIYKISKLGGGNVKGVFGTSLEYAPYVIGDSSQSARNSHWWKISDIGTRAAAKIEEIWNNVAKDLAEFLKGKGG